MKNAGMNTAGVSQIADEPTLFSVCFQYPDKSGGNITTSNSAADLVSKEDIDAFFENMPVDGENEIILSVPEVPLAPRIRILEHGRKRGSLNICSVLSGEASGFVSDGNKTSRFAYVNIDEAIAIVGGNAENRQPVKLHKSAPIDLWKIADIMPSYQRAGGCYTWHQGGEHTRFARSKMLYLLPGRRCIVGRCYSRPGMRAPIDKGHSDKKFGSTPLTSAVELGNLVSNLKVTTPDTISPIECKMLYEVCSSPNFRLSSEFKAMLPEAQGRPKGVIYFIYSINSVCPYITVECFRYGLQAFFCVKAFRPFPVSATLPHGY